MTSCKLRGSCQDELMSLLLKFTMLIDKALMPKKSTHLHLHLVLHHDHAVRVKLLCRCRQVRHL